MALQLQSQMHEIEGDKVLLKCTAFKGKHKIQDRWENTIYEVIGQPLGKIPAFKIKSTEGDDKTKVVHRNLLLPLFSDPSDHTSKSDTKSMVDQTVSVQEVIAVGALPVICITWVVMVEHG